MAFESASLSPRFLHGPLLHTAFVVKDKFCGVALDVHQRFAYSDEDSSIGQMAILCRKLVNLPACDLTVLGMFLVDVVSDSVRKEAYEIALGASMLCIKVLVLLVPSQTAVCLNGKASRI